MDEPNAFNTELEEHVHKMILFWFVPALPVIRLSATQSSDNGTIGPTPPAFGHLGFLGVHGLHGHLGSRGVLGHRRPRTEDLAHQGTHRT